MKLTWTERHLQLVRNQKHPIFQHRSMTCLAIHISSSRPLGILMHLEECTMKYLQHQPKWRGRRRSSHGKRRDELLSQPGYLLSLESLAHLQLLSRQLHPRLQVQQSQVMPCQGPSPRLTHGQHFSHAVMPGMTYQKLRNTCKESNNLEEERSRSCTIRLRNLGLELNHCYHHQSENASQV